MFNFDKTLIKLDLEEFQELFLWAVISGLPDMMHMLWSHGEDYLRKALIGEYVSNLMIETGEKHRMADDAISKYRCTKKYDQFFVLFFVCFLIERKKTINLYGPFD